MDWNNVLTFIDSHQIEILDAVLALLLSIFFLRLVSRMVKTRNLILFLFVVFVGRSIAESYQMKILVSIIDIATTSGIVWFFVIYQNELRDSLTRRKGQKFRSNFIFSSKEEKGENLEAVVDSLTISVLSMSAGKTGAIITIERSDSLDNFIQTGVQLDVPVKEELINTIFYPGTPLHDGALIIRDNRIKAASVYYTPTTKALTGKYGARHRAALGISEMCDALTIVVSEETGRISFAVHGELSVVSRDDFKKRLLDELSEPSSI